MVGPLLLTTGTGRADDYTWNAAAGGNWSEGAKWDRTGGGTGVPGAADTATIDVAGAYTVDLNDTRGIATATLNRSTATLNLNSGPSPSAPPST